CRFARLRGALERLRTRRARGPSRPRGYRWRKDRHRSASDDPELGPRGPLPWPVSCMEGEAHRRGAPLTGAELFTAVCQLLYREAALLDERKWEEWLGLYAEAAVFWMPSWASESQTTDDPEHELNLLYLKGRSHLEDRVFRLRTGDSFASVPMD